jgi:hypothetical protein
MPLKALALAGALAALGAASAVLPADDPRLALRHPGHVASVGTPPPTSKAEVDGYESTGDAEILGYGIVEFSNNTYMPCTTSLVFLFPDTSYVRWRLNAIALLLDSSSKADVEPDVWWIELERALPPVPDYYRLFRRRGSLDKSPQSNLAIRTTNCRSNSSYIFEHVPAGRYIVAFLPRVTTEESVRAEPQFYERQISSDEIEMGYERGPDTTHTAYGEGFLVHSGILTVDAPKRYLIPLTGLVTMAHFDS